MPKYDPLKPYNSLPDLPPKANLETRQVNMKLISTSRAFSELNGAIFTLPNPLLFIDTINLQEAHASSAIENIITTQDELFQASIADKLEEDPAMKEVMHYKEALWHGLAQLKKRPVLTTSLFISIMRIIKKNQSGIRNLPGTQLRNPSTKQVVYTPPYGEDVIREKLKSLEIFINTSDDLDPLIKLGLIHYQFEAIHPFFDGNGRTGRIIMLLYLNMAGLMQMPSLYLSRYILKHRDDYYRNIRAVTEKGEWTRWVLFVLDMIETTAKQGRQRIENIKNTMKKTGDEMQKKLPKVYSKDLLEVLFHLPYTKRAALVEAGIGNAKTAGSYLTALEEKGFLKSKVVGKEKLYLNKRLMTLLNDE